MISDSWVWNLISGVLLALVAFLAACEAKSSSLVPRSLLLWPLLLIGFGLVTVAQGLLIYGFSVTVILGIVLALSGFQALLVNIRRLAPWPSGAVWLVLVIAGGLFQMYPYFEQRLMGYLWIAVALAKVTRERSAALESGTPFWIQLLYVQSILLAAYR